jgi:hypothetical protein
MLRTSRNSVTINRRFPLHFLFQLELRDFLVRTCMCSLISMRIDTHNRSPEEMGTIMSVGIIHQVR